MQVYAPTSESDEDEIDKFYDMLDKAREQCQSQEVVITMGQDTGTRNAIFTLRMICERSIEMQKDIHLCSIDYSKVFGKVKHEQQLLDMLQDLDIDGKDIRNLYWEQPIGMRIEGGISN